MASAIIKPPGRLSCGVTTELRVASAAVRSPGRGSVTSVTSVTPLVHKVFQHLGAGPPLFSVFCFPLPPTTPDPPGPGT